MLYPHPLSMTHLVDDGSRKRFHEHALHVAITAVTFRHVRHQELSYTLQLFDIVYYVLYHGIIEPSGGPLLILL